MAMCMKTMFCTYHYNSCEQKLLFVAFNEIPQSDKHPESAKLLLYSVILDVLCKHYKEEVGSITETT